MRRSHLCSRRCRWSAGSRSITRFPICALPWRTAFDASHDSAASRLCRRWSRPPQESGSTRSRRIGRGLPLRLHLFLNALKQRYTLELVETKCRPIFQHQFCLAQLRQSGLRLAVASNSVRLTVDRMMDRADLARFLEVTVSNEDV